MKTETILEHAEIAAVFLRAMIDKGVPLHTATQMASSYLSSHMMTEAMRDKPKEPWEGDGS